MTTGPVRTEAPSASDPRLRLWEPLIVGGALSLVVLFGSMGLMYAVGLLDIAHDSGGEKTLAASLAVVGSLVTASVTLLGVVLKYSLDFRTYALGVDAANRARIDAQRNYDLAREAEHRNSTDAAIRAVALLAHDGQETTATQMGGALLALVSLGSLDLAVALLAELWPKRLVSRQVADVVLTNAFKSDSEHTLDSAAVVLADNAAAISEGETYFWPLSDLGWSLGLPPNCRRSLLDATAKWCAQAALTVNLSYPGAVVLTHALSDPDQGRHAAEGLRAVVEGLGEGWSNDFGFTRITAAEIRDLLKDWPETPSFAGEIIRAARREHDATEAPPA